MTPIIRLLSLTLVFLLALNFAATATRMNLGVIRSQPAVELLSPETSSTDPTNLGAHALLDRVILALSLSALIIAIALVFALGRREGTPAGTPAPFSSRARERRSLDLLATTSARAQEEIGQERDEREKAQADAQQRLQLLNRALEEKIRIGRDLHDGVIQSLYATGLTLESAKLQTHKNPVTAEQQLTQGIDLINRSIGDIRSYISGLSPRSVRRDSLAAGLAEAVEELRAGRPLDVDWKIDEACVAELSDAQITETVQITREAVSNALRHGGARQLTLALARGDSGSVLTIRDDGRGFSLKKANPDGNGLGDMKARTEDALGEFTLTSAPGEGTCIQVSWRTASSI
ncbi:histidine kinase [bacterium]|nr:histidine kinase [bacterium]